MRTITHLWLLLTLPGIVFAGEVPVPTQGQAWYYDIGGAEPVSIALNPAGASQILDAHASLTASYSCGNFDITTSVTHAFSNVTTSLQNTVMSAATGAISALPLYVFQRASPGLYELFQTYAADFTLNFGDAIQSCEQMEKEILAGKDPYAEWVQLAKAGDWRSLMGTTADAVTAKQQVESSGGAAGYPFPKVSSGAVVMAGGTSGPPIEPIKDITGAGWNTTLGRLPGDNTLYIPPATGPEVRLATLFPSPGAAANYAVDVLGDTVIRTCPGCPKRGIPGNGLNVKYAAHRQAIATNLVALVGGTGVPTNAALQQVSAPGVAVSAKVIETLRELPTDEAGVFTGRLASEVAISRTIEEAFAIRRLLISGKRVPEVMSTKPAMDVAVSGIAELEQEIDSFLFEQRVSKEIASNAAGIVVARRNQLDARSQQTQRQGRPEASSLEEGGRFQ
jgi:integrating conjugative element protein (TIGR03755 family)